MLRGKLAAVMLSRGDHPGFRIVRIIRARWNVKLKQIVRLDVRAYGGTPNEKTEFNGHIYKNLDRKEFVGPCRGVVVERAVFQPIDEYTIDAIQLRKVERRIRRQQNDLTSKPTNDNMRGTSTVHVNTVNPDEERELPSRKEPAVMAKKSGPPALTAERETREHPPLAPTCAFVRIDELDLISFRAKLATYKLRDVSLPDDPQWELTCPNGATLHFAAYFDKVLAEHVMHIIAYTNPDGKIFGGNPKDPTDVMSPRDVGIAIRSFLTNNPSPKPPPVVVRLPERTEMSPFATLEDAGVDKYVGKQSLTVTPTVKPPKPPKPAATKTEKPVIPAKKASAPKLSKVKSVPKPPAATEPLPLPPATPETPPAPKVKRPEDESDLSSLDSLLDGLGD